MNILQEKAYDEMTLIEMAQTHIDRCQYDLAGLILRMAQVQTAEHQAAALERIAAVLEKVTQPDGANSINVFITDMAKDTADYLRVGSWLR